MTEAMTYDKPLPAFDDANRPFWVAAREGRLVLQHCGGCGKPRYPINHVCPHCLCDAFEWKAISGRGTVHSSIVFHQIYNQAFAPDVPYNVSLIQLAEGPRMVTNIVDCDFDTLKCEQAVKVVFKPTDGGPPLPMFTPA